MSTHRSPVSRFQARLHHARYAPVLALAMGLMLVRLLIMARVMDLPSFAIFSAGLLISSSFCMLSCLGLQPLMQREFPIMIVRQRERAASAMLIQCALVAVACAVFSASLIAGFGIPFAGLSPTLMVIALLHGLSQQLFVVATVESRSRGASLRFAYQNLVRAILMLPAAIAVAVFADAAAVLATEAVMSLLLAAWLLCRQFKAIPSSIRSLTILAWRRLPRAAWRSALALLAVSILSFLLINIDRWLAAEQLPASAFAQYAFAWTIPMVAQSLQVVINASLFPFLARHFASNGRVKTYRVSVKASLAVLFGGAVASLPIWGVLDFSVSRWFGAYDGSRELFPVFLLISLLRLSDFWSSYLIVIGQEVKLLALNLMTAVVGAFVWWLVVHPDAGSMKISQVAALSLILATAGYLVNAWSAWACSNGFRQEVA